MSLQSSKSPGLSRWWQYLHVWMQAALVIAVFGLVNYLGFRHFQRYDMTETRRFSLSPETLSYLRQLPQPVQVIITLSPDEEEGEMAQAFRDLRSLLREYSFASRHSTGGAIEVEIVNIYQQRRRAQILQLEFANMVYLRSGDRERLLGLNDLYETRDRARKQFQGERAITSALLDLTSESREVLYFLTGHGEMSLRDVDPARGLSQLRLELEARNLELRTIDLSSVSAIPKDASLIVGISSQTPFFPQEQEMLRRFLGADAGRLLLFIDPARRHGLEALFFDWGILVEDVMLHEPNERFRISGGDLLIRRFGEHTITRTLIENQIPLVTGPSRSVRIDPGRPLDDSLIITELLSASDESWGERNYLLENPFVFHPRVDLRGPVRLAAVAERRVDSRLGISIPGGRLIVLGTSDLVSNGRLGDGGNLTFILSAINWAIDRDRILNIPDRPVRRLQLTLSGTDLLYARFGTWLGPPLALFLLGMLVYLFRHS